jgi:CheY-like chemotaxis protein
MFPSGVGMLQAYGVYLLALIPLLGLAWVWCGRERQLQDQEDERRSLLNREKEVALAPPEQAVAPSPPAAAAPMPPRLAKEGAAVKKQMLIVDDSAVVRAKLRKLFEARYEVTLAEDGEQAWAMIEAGTPFSVVLTDLEMPNMDGFELIGAIQRGLDTEDLPIIAITGSEDLKARVQTCQGLFGIFQKPWVDRELIKRVDAISNLRTFS